MPNAILVGIAAFFAALTGLALVVEFAKVLMIFPWAIAGPWVWLAMTMIFVTACLMQFTKIFLVFALARVVILPFAYMGIASVNYIAGHTYRVLTLSTFMDDLLGCLYLPLLMCLGIFKSLAMISSDTIFDACNAVSVAGKLMGPERALDYAWRSFKALFGYLLVPWAYPEVQSSVAAIFGESASERLKYANVTSYSIIAGYLASCTAKGAFENWYQVCVALWAVGIHLVNESLIVYERIRTYMSGTPASPES